MSQLDDTPIITLRPTSIPLPSYAEEYWETKVRQARAKMKEMGIEHLLEKRIEKKLPKLRRRIS